MTDVYLVAPMPFREGDINVKLDPSGSVKVYRWLDGSGWRLSGFSSPKMGTIAKKDLKYVAIARQWCVGSNIQAWIREF
jgi:hypothetical protein